MAITDGKEPRKESVKTAEGLDLTVTTKVRIIQRDLATRWPSSDPNAENINAFQDYLSILLDEGWKIEETRFFDAGPAGEGGMEKVYPIIMLLTR